MRIEIMPGEGGADAELFAKELANAISKESGSSVVSAGTTQVLENV